MTICEDDAQANALLVRWADTVRKDFVAITGEIPSPLNPPSGCHFHPRCPHASARCRSEAPALQAIAPGRLVACHLHGPAAPAAAPAAPPPPTP